MMVCFKCEVSPQNYSQNVNPDLEPLLDCTKVVPLGILTIQL